MIAAVYLAGTAATALKSLATGLIPITCNEIRRLLTHLIPYPVTSPEPVLLEY